jgi:hypothetical protein
MSSFNYLVQRAQILGEANVTSAPFVGVRKALTQEGLPSSSLDALKFIAEVLSRLDIISIEVHDQVVSGQYAAETTEGQGPFKKKAASILKVLRDYESEINRNTEEIQDYIQKQLKNFTNISATNRGRNIKYKERAKDIAKAKTQMAAGEDADDALADLVIKVISHLDDDAIERADIEDDINPDASRAMRDAQERSLADKDYVIEIAFNNPDIKATLVKMLTPFIAAGEDSIFTDEGDTNFDIKVSPDSKLVNNPLLLPGADRNVEKFETELGNALTSAAGDEVRVVVHEPTSVFVAAAAAQRAKDQKQKTMRNMINTARRGPRQDNVINGDEDAEQAEGPPYIETNKEGTYYYSDAAKTVLHRTDGPAVEYATDGYKEWRLNGVLHREDGPAVEDATGHKEWYINGKLHREGAPAVEDTDGYKEWRLNGVLHREDGPAVEYTNGLKEWYINGKRHREDGPAVEDNDGYKEWRLNGVLHRKDGPAVEDTDGYKEWRLNGELHRKDGPAVEDDTGHKEWWIAGRRVNEDGSPHIDYYGDEDEEDLTLEGVYNTMGFIKAPVIDENGIISSTCSTQQYLTEATEQLFEESGRYTAGYLTDQIKADSYKSTPKQNYIGFKERFKPKTQSQLEEIIRYGL